jgi:hypothetical protein
MNKSFMLGSHPLSYPSDQDILTKRTANCTSRSDDNIIAISLNLLKCFNSGQFILIITNN